MTANDTTRPERFIHACRKDTAYEHFRERIAEFFRRYPYDEWYPLNQQELEAYINEYPDVQPFPWQQVGTSGKEPD